MEAAAHWRGSALSAFAVAEQPYPQSIGIGNRGVRLAVCIQCTAERNSLFQENAAGYDHGKMPKNFVLTECGQAGYKDAGPENFNLGIGGFSGAVKYAGGTVDTLLQSEEKFSVQNLFR
ncbi:MAG: hypothetical protein ACLRIL_07900 [Fusicatenibacter saccharivorans]